MPQTHLVDLKLLDMLLVRVGVQEPGDNRFSVHRLPSSSNQMGAPWL